MKFLLLIILFGCSTLRKFPEKDVCFLLYDLEEKSYKKNINPENCKKALPAVSTFKVPLSLMAFNEGILQDEQTTILWDKRQRTIEAWNKDHTAASWMKDSVVWFSQSLTSQLGEQKIVKYLEEFKFGNADMSGGIRTAWLTDAPFIDEPVQNSLTISAYEQVDFLEKLWLQKLPLSSYAINMTQKILVREPSRPQIELVGKTGSGFMDKQFNYRLGWFVGHLKVNDKEYIVVTNFIDNKVIAEPRAFGGTAAKELTKELLREENLW